VWLVDLLLPERCAGCGAEEAAFCASCTSRLTRIRPPLCACCGAPVAWPVSRCRECAGRRLGFATARGAVAYEDRASRLVWAWKEGGRRGFALLAAQLVAETISRPSADVVTFVPSSRDRELWRGHNTAQELAEQLATLWNLPAAALIQRGGSARRQRGLGLRERRTNVGDAFAAASRPPPAVALVDDVYTSGATAGAAALALRRGGADRVDVVTFARTLRGLGGGTGVR
jgi:predicted amidophosphoribosyltransferase